MMSRHCATRGLIDQRPELLKRFLRGRFKTIAYMKTHKDFVVQSGEVLTRR